MLIDDRWSLDAEKEQSQIAQATNPNPDELVFKPVYPGRIRFTLYLYPVGILACIFFIFMAIYSKSVFPNLIYAFIFGFTLLTVPMILFREVRFGEVITLKSWFRPRRTIRYEDVVGLTERGLVAKHGGIPLVNVQNRAEFEKIIRRLANQRKIKLVK